MRLGVISDIHGDLKALENVLAQLKHHHHVDGIWCAGDLVGRGQHPNEVVEKVVGRGIPTVLGNHDEFIIALHQTTYNATQVFGYRPQVVQLLMTLPRTYRATLAGRTLVMVHGTPRSNTESLNLVAPRQREYALNWLGKIGADILITGHTHTPTFVQDRRGMIINPGSLFDPTGLDRSSSETYGVLDISAMHFAHHPVWG